MASPLLYIGLFPSCVKQLSELRDDFSFYRDPSIQLSSELYSGNQCLELLTVVAVVTVMANYGWEMNNDNIE
ncbi:hypothetical protein KY285_005937 [Solanum tuberosum]|nr:hypothetical protein KY284_005994 [Solanum tuberosum]KAH0723383.1 hypothetical protein KY289_006427 [Solanum tuberosum]KAH0752789.1 hypothetical protein KY285_005937 [Solanum tuberosum]